MAPFGKLRDRGSFGTVSELVELAIKFKEGQNIFKHLFRCKTQRFKWRSCSGASPSQLLSLLTSSYQSMANKSGGGLEPRLAKRRALFPEGRGLGVGGRKRKSKSKSKIGVGRNGLFVSPSLRTGLADLPHPALQLMVLPQRGLTSHFMGG